MAVKERDADDADGIVRCSAVIHDPESNITHAFDPAKRATTAMSISTDTFRNQSCSEKKIT